MENCIFCSIIQGDIPSSKVYEDEQVLAFLDISQTTKGHTLVIPKQHVRNLLEMTAETASHLFARIPKIARAIQSATGATLTKRHKHTSLKSKIVWPNIKKIVS